MPNKNNNKSIFAGVLDAISSNRRKKIASDDSSNYNNARSFPNINPEQSTEDMQQQFLDWQVNKISHDLYTRTVYYDTDRISAYQDFRAMDGTPEIAAALDIIRDECLDANTIVPLLNGEEKTIEQLYNEGIKNFYVYSYNTDEGKIIPAICERVTYKGVQDVYEITFDDGSTIRSTDEHLWLLKGKAEYKKTKELKQGDSVEPYYTILSDLTKEINTSIKFIKHIGKNKTYDLVNVGEYSNFAVKTSNGTGVFSHNCLTRSERGNILEVYSENIRVKNTLTDLFHNVLNLEYNLRLWIRDLVKYGDYFVMMQVDKEVGIYDFLTLPMEEVHREEGYDGRTSSVRFRWETTGDYFEEWQVAHFRLLEDSRKLPYGRSILDSARKLWKQLQLAEDAMLVYRITRAPERRIFYVEVGNTPPEDIKAYLSKIQNRIRKQSMVDSKTGRVAEKYNPQNVTEDYWIPMRGDKGSKIETLPGACIALDTKIPLLDGRTLELKEIVDEWNSGNRNLWAYSCNPKTGELAPGMITWAGVTRKNAKTLKITLDNGKVLITTPDHKWVHRTKGFVEAKGLKVGDSIMPFYRDKKKIKTQKYVNEYERVWDNSKQEWKFTHRMVSDFNGIEIKELVFDERFKQGLNKHIASLSSGEKANREVEKLYNHKIVKIEEGDVQDTGTITIDGGEKYHNFHTFATDSEVFIKNSNLDQIQDIEYLQAKLFAALQVPKTYLNYTEDLKGGSTLSQTDLRFSRTINSIQQAIVMELRRVANTHLYFLGMVDDIDNFSLSLTNPSTQQEMLKLETMKLRLEVFKEFFNNEVHSPSSYTWAMENILGFSKSEIKLMLKQKKVEKKLFTEIESSVETYKKIGLFDDLDERYEDPEAVKQFASQGKQGEEEPDLGGGGGGFSSSSSFGGFGGELGGGEEGEEPITPEGGESEEPGTEEPLSEKYIKKEKKSNIKTEFLINELFNVNNKEDDVETNNDAKNMLFESNTKMTNATKKLIESIENNLPNAESVEFEVVDEEDDDNNNKLLDSNKKNIDNIQSTFDTLDELES